MADISNQTTKDGVTRKERYKPVTAAGQVVFLRNSRVEKSTASGCGINKNNDVMSDVDVLY